MDRQRLNPGTFGNLGNRWGVAMLAVLAGTDLQGHRYVHCADDGIQNLTD